MLLMNTIQTSLDWPRVCGVIEQPARQLKQHTRQMLRLSKNIGIMVTALGNEEIQCRRIGRQTARHIKLLEQINQEIANYEQLITFGLMLV